MNSDLADTLDDLAGFAWIPGIADFLNFARTTAQAAADGDLTTDQTQTVLSLLGNPHGPDLPQTLALLAKTLTNPTTNPALAGLPEDTAKQVQHLGEIHAYETAEYTPRDCTNEAAALISEGRCTQMTRITDDERKELSQKVAKANKQSSNRPR